MPPRRLPSPRHCLAALALVLSPAPLLAEPLTEPNAGEADRAIEQAKALIRAGQLPEARALLEDLAARIPDSNEVDFLLGLIAASEDHFERAIRHYRRILDREPGALRVRLELARTLFLAKEDEQADYHFKLAIAQNPPEAVIRNIARFREAIRARRAWRFNVNVGIAPDSNINSATSKEQVEVLGLPFRLDEDAKARSGVGLIAGGDASVRVWRFAKVPLYLGAYGRMVRYGNHDFDDIYIGGEAGPELRLSGGRLRVTATAFRRWYGGDTLVTSPGARLAFDKVIKGKWSLDAGLALRRDDYARRRDLDGWTIDASLSANRALSASALGFGYLSLRRAIANDPGQSNWAARLGGGVLKEIGWGLRPQLSFEVGRQLNDARLGLFGRTRRDWSLLASASIYKRDWNIAGFAPSIRLTWSRNFSTIALYDQKRLRTEFGLAKAF